jgi:hypothetical protein
LIIVKRPRMQDLILHLVMTKRLRKTARVPSKNDQKAEKELLCFQSPSKKRQCIGSANPSSLA